MIFNGLRLANINIEPHFILDDLSDNNKKLQRNEIIKESYNREIYALKDGAYILDNTKSQTIFGECYKIYKGNIKKICNDVESINIK